MIVNIILLIFKIIGILLLAIIALLLLLVLTVLIVPIRYVVNARHGSDVYADGRISWLLHLINARISYDDEVLHIRVRFIVFTLYDNLKPKKKNKQRKRTSRVENNHRLLNNKNIEHNKSEDDINNSDINYSDTGIINKVATDRVNNINNINITVNDDSDSSNKPNDNEKNNKFTFSIFIDRIKCFIEKIKKSIIAFKEKIVRLFQTVTDIKSKINLVRDFIKNKINREGLSLTYSEIKKILKHILPGKLKSTIKFGTGDPCSTGQALGAISILYSFYGDKITIIPDFENRVLEGKHYAKGRIRLLTILIIVFKLIKDKRFKLLKRNFELLKEAL